MVRAAIYDLFKSLDRNDPTCVAVYSSHIHTVATCHNPRTSLARVAMGSRMNRCRPAEDTRIANSKSGKPTGQTFIATERERAGGGHVHMSGN